MSGLSMIGGAGRNGLMANASNDSGAADQVTQGQDFASMMGAGQQANQASRASAAPQAKERPQAREDGQASQDTDPQDQQATSPAREGASAEAGERAVAQAKPAGKPASGKDTATESDDKDDAWPPAGLGGFGLNLLPLAPTALASQATPLGGNGLAIGTGGGASTPGLTALVAGLAAGAAQADGTALAQGASAATSTAVNQQAGAGFASLLSQSAAQPAQAPAEAGNALAAAALAQAIGSKPADDASGADAGAVDPINLLATTVPQSPVRDVAGVGAPFTGSPTPTPNLHADNFDDAMGARMSWLADQKIGHAHIKLSPADLGPVEVRLHLSGDQVNAAFSSNHAEVRHALENSLPRLREMLGQHGFQLGQADVGQHQQSPSQGGSGTSAGPGGELAEDGMTPAGIPSVVLRQRGLLDAYA
ncbi:flagellar hook-length control protein FliK [Pseudoxanthomonas sp. JBR18]|uniref:flagellar hook-length control protein FliK n=1 Tax=Pseudoxanthomonas sp. JBR18 TaxID=2969308 RepID=UPI002306A507|nr:flagellar hook-length control protein FliK [Pseudoxanthomonas sp. JBR18]WCE03729.1 flagellar hook-length control protein FliK [Pseudoxanthomonas sp. JBR18]